MYRSESATEWSRVKLIISLVPQIASGERVAMRPAMSSTPDDQRVVVVEDLVDQPDLERPLRRHPVAGVGQLAGDALGDQLRQALQRADVRGHADVDLLDAEERVRAGSSACPPRRPCRPHRRSQPPWMAASTGMRACFERGEGVLQVLHHHPQVRSLATRLGRAAAAGQARAAGEHRQVHARRRSAGRWTRSRSPGPTARRRSPARSRAARSRTPGSWC